MSDVAIEYEGWRPGFRITKGSFWLHGENGWGQRQHANVYETVTDAERVAKRLHTRGEPAQVLP